MKNKPVITFAGLGSKEAISFGVMYLSAVLKRRGYGVRLLLAESAEEFQRRWTAHATEVLAFSVTTGLHRHYAEWARRAAACTGAHVIAGGPHPTYFPDFVNTPGIHAICTGEGEEALPEYLDAFTKAGGPPDAAVQGFRHWRGDTLLDGGFRPPVVDLDSLPSPDWPLFFEANPNLATHRVKSFLATRGCPYRCTYCFNRNWNDRNKALGARSVRVRDPDRVVHEILEVKKRWPMRLVWFLDANFACNRKWLAEFLPRYRRAIGLPFFCKVRPNSVNDDLADQLVAAGMTSVGIGIESGNDHLRNAVLERGMSQEQILGACHAFVRRGVLVMSFNMLGLPGETYEMARQTLDLNVAGRVDYAMTMFLQPFPGTEIARRAQEMGLFDGNFDHLSSSYFMPSPLRFPTRRDRRRITNLQRLLALSVAFPEVRRFVDFLVDLPPNPLYLELFKTFNHRSFHRRFYRAETLQPVARR